MPSITFVIEYIFKILIWRILIWVWSERLFFTSFLTLLAVGYISYQSYLYQRKISEPPEFEFSGVKFVEEGPLLSATIQNIGNGRCDELQLESYIVQCGNGERSKETPHVPHIKSHMDPGEKATIQLIPLTDDEICDGTPSAVMFNLLADGNSVLLTIYSDDFESE